MIKVKKDKSIKETNLNKKLTIKEVFTKENLEHKVLVNILDKIKYRAIIYNNTGEQIATLEIKRDEKSFNYKDKKYLTDFNCKTYLKRSGFFKKFKYFYYNINNINPLEFDLTKNSKIKTEEFNPELLNVMLETKVVKDLNNVNKSLFGNIKPIHIIIGLVVLVVGYYFISGGSLV